MSHSHSHSHASETTNLVPPTDAHSAYSDKDVEASMAYHTGRHEHGEENHQSGGDKLKAIIFGGLDGILTSFAIIAGGAGSGQTSTTILAIGASSVVADAMAMGVGEFLSTKAHNEWVLQERGREKWEVENYLEGEIEEMIDIFIEKGMSKEDASLFINIIAKYPEQFVDFMMTEELGLELPEDDHVWEAFKVRGEEEYVLGNVC